MKVTIKVETNLKINEANEKVKGAARLAMRDTTVAIAKDTVALSPVKTGNNRRSIKYEVSGMGINEMVAANKIEGAIYSTSGYGGYLETGHFTHSGSFVSARPYFKPALDLNFTPEKFVDTLRGYLK